MPDARKEIIKAAKNGDVQNIQRLLAGDTELLHARDADGSTPLHCAAWKGHPETVACLLATGADVGLHNTNDHWGTTPLHAAAHANQAAIVEMLIAHGADVNAHDMSGRTPLHHTTFHKAKAAARVLERHGAK